MNSDQKTIFVTGATGNQGGAVAHHLLKSGWHIKALTRNADSPKAKALAAAGADLVQGDLDHIDSFADEFEDVYGLFSVQGLNSGVMIEEQQGKALADAAEKAGIQHLVYSSVGGAERETGIPHFDSKWHVEEHIQTLNIPTTVLRPAYFMDNFNWQRDNIAAGKLTSMGLGVDKSLQMIAAYDIGAFATLAFNNPETYIGQSLEIAGDDLTEAQMVTILTKVTGKTVELVPNTGAATFEDMQLMFDWFAEAGYEADIPVLRTQLPGFMNFETWLRKNGWG